MRSFSGTGPNQTNNEVKLLANPESPKKGGDKCLLWVSMRGEGKKGGRARWVVASKQDSAFDNARMVQELSVFLSLSLSHFLSLHHSTYWEQPATVRVRQSSMSGVSSGSLELAEG